MVPISPVPIPRNRTVQVCLGRISLAGLLAHQCVLRNTLSGSKNMGSISQIDSCNRSIIECSTENGVQAASQPHSLGAPVRAPRPALPTRRLCYFLPPQKVYRRQHSAMAAENTECIHTAYAKRRPASKTHGADVTVRGGRWLLAGYIGWGGKLHPVGLIFLSWARSRQTPVRSFAHNFAAQPQ